AETRLPDTTAAPSVDSRKNHQQQADADQKKIGTGVPKIVHGVELPATHIKPPCQIDERNSTDCDERELLVASVSPPVARHQQSNCQASKSRTGPRKNREEPRLGF